LLHRLYFLPQPRTLSREKAAKLAQKSPAPAETSCASPELIYLRPLLSHPDPLLFYSLSTSAVSTTTRHFTSYTNTTGSLPPSPLTSLPERPHLVGIRQHGIASHRKHTNIHSRCYFASALVVGTHCLAHEQPRVGQSADASHRLAAWAPWAYQRINF
jgi:hypothetical protein